MITSSTNQARHKPTPKRSKKETPIPAIVTIESEPELSKIDEGWYYFWAKHQNSKRKDWSILCEEHQVSWVIEQKQNKVQLIEGTHFSDQRVQTEDGKVTRSILSDDFFNEEPVEDDDPMTWQEVPVVAQDPEPIKDPVAIHTLKRYDILCLCWDAAGVTPSEEQRAEAIRTLNAGVLIECKQRR